jgi:hypothetical protein
LDVSNQVYPTPLLAGSGMQSETRMWRTWMDFPEENQALTAAFNKVYDLVDEIVRGRPH